MLEAMERDIILYGTSFRFPFNARTDALAQPETEPVTNNSIEELREEERIDKDDF